MHPLQRFTHPPATKDPASLPAPAESRQGGCTPSLLDELTRRPFVGGLVVAVLLLAVGLGLSVLIGLARELAR